MKAIYVEDLMRILENSNEKDNWHSSYTLKYLKDLTGRMEGTYTVDQYQTEAARTINQDLPWKQQGRHALHGMVGEIGELHSIYQKKYQGHPFDEVHAQKELGDLLWFIAEYCTAHDWRMSDIMQMNIEKLIARYPDGFNEDKSLNRKDGDI